MVLWIGGDTKYRGVEKDCASSRGGGGGGVEQVKDKGNKRAGRREETENWYWINKGDEQRERGTPQNRD